MNTEYRIARLERTLGTLIAWSQIELGLHNTNTLLDMLKAPEDPDNLEGPGRTPEEMAAERRALNAVAPTPTDRFQLMFGTNQRDLLNRFANALSACLNTYPDLRVEEVHGPLFAEYRKLKP